MLCYWFTGGSVETDVCSQSAAADISRFLQVHLVITECVYVWLLDCSKLWHLSQSEASICNNDGMTSDLCCVSCHLQGDRSVLSRFPGWLRRMEHHRCVRVGR